MTNNPDTQPTVTEALLPCPFCGGDTARIDQNGQNSYDVTCWKCEAGTIAYGPSAGSHGAAITAWNTRTQQTARPADPIAKADEALVTTIINVYNTARSSSTSGVDHVLSKRIVQDALARHRSQETARSADVGRAAALQIEQWSDEYEAANKDRKKHWGDCLHWGSVRFIGQRFAALTTPPADDEHETCQRCGGHNPSWAAPSPLWNAVMRGGCIDGDPLFGDMVCVSCFIALAMEQGAASDFRVDARTVNVTLQTTTPSGRTWDDKSWLWRDAGEPVAPADDGGQANG